MSEVFTYMPQGTCSKQMDFELDGEIIKSVRIIGGCPGNLLGISRILVGMNVNDVIKAFSGVRCGGKPTSCPDQIAQGLAKHFQSVSE